MSPTANLYADGQMSVPSALRVSRIPRHYGRRRSNALGVGDCTPTATLGVYGPSA
jgi:hypothetical protein